MRGIHTVLLVAMLASGGGVFAHATLVLGTFAIDPTSAAPGAPFTLVGRLLDLTQEPVEDARVLAEFHRPSLARPLTVRLRGGDARRVPGDGSSPPEG